MSQLDYLNIYRVASGRCPGMQFVEFVARNPDVDTGTVPETISCAGGLLTFRAAAAVVELVSDSAADSAAGTGARTIAIDGLDANWDVISETVTLNGLTPVLTTKSFLRINRATVVSAGSSASNVGNVMLRDSGAGAARSHISPLRGRAETAMLSVPRDHILMGDGWYATAGLGGGNKSTALIDVMEIDGVTGVSKVAWTVGIDGSFTSGFSVPHLFHEKTDIHIIVREVGANDTIVSFHGHGIMVGPNADL